MDSFEAIYFAIFSTLFVVVLIYVRLGRIERRLKLVLGVDPFKVDNPRVIEKIRAGDINGAIKLQGLAEGISIGEAYIAVNKYVANHPADSKT